MAEGKDARGKFAKGNKCGHGRPRKPEVEELRIAIDQVQKKENCPLLVHYVRRAYENDAVLIALGKKLIPDLSSVDGDFRHRLEVFRLCLGAPKDVEKQDDQS